MATADLTAIRDRVLALIAKQSAEIQRAVDESKTDVAKGYAALAESADDESAFTRLRDMLAASVQTLRQNCHGLALSHCLAELRELVGDGAGNVTIPAGANPDPADVAKYVGNAVETARVAVAGASDDGKAEAFKRAAYHADSILESEAIVAYQAARAAGEKHLAAMSREETDALGFRIAKSESDLRSFAELETREDGKLIVMVGRRWDSRSAACPKCAAVHGEIRPFGFSFSLPGPTAHSRCQCVTTWWAVAVLTSERSIPMSDTPLPERTEAPFLRAYVALDDTREIDEETRTIRNAIASDESEDSHGSIIKSDGWDLSRYEKNPVLIWAHKTGGWSEPEPEDVLGTTTTRVADKRLVTDLHFDTAPKSETVFGKMKNKVIRGLSVGFRPLAYHWEKRGEGDDELLVIDRAMLVEISVVPIPSNPNTLANQMRGFEAGKTPEPKRSETQATPAPCCTEPVSPTAAQPQESVSMSDTKSHAETLPAALAAVLGCQDVDSAVRAIADRDLAVKAANDKTAKAEERAAAAEATVAKYRDAEERAIVEMVEALISSGREPETKREALLVTAKAAPEAFRKLYPAQEEPPRKVILDRIVKPADKTNTERAAAETGESPVMKRVAELRATGKSFMDAYSQALNEYELSRASA